MASALFRGFGKFAVDDVTGRFVCPPRLGFTIPSKVSEGGIAPMFVRCDPRVDNVDVAVTEDECLRQPRPGILLLSLQLRLLLPEHARALRFALGYCLLAHIAFPGQPEARFSESLLPL